MMVNLSEFDFMHFHQIRKNLYVQPDWVAKG
jgi:hypothetical protein